MTDKEKIRISKIDLYKIRDISKELVKLYESKEALIFSLYGTGIDYSKDRIQTSPVNMMEEAFATASEMDQRIDKLIDVRKDYMKRIYKIADDGSVNLLIDVYRNLKTYNSIAQELNVAKTTVFDRHKKALILYFDTNY